MSEENGIIVGVVTNLNDPEQLGRVRVSYPTLEDQESYWARIVTPMGGKSRGFHFRPEVDDEVLVAFEANDPRRPCVLGAMWSKPDAPPPDDGANKNNWRFIVSRSGHKLIFNDTDGGETIEIIDHTGDRKVIIDSAGKKIQVIAQDGDVEVSAPSGTVKVNAKTVQVEGTTVEIKATNSLTLEAASMELKASGSMKLKATMIDIN
jgi:uncharacterized protein involved in type VI secretion and phage assembly